MTALNVSIMSASDLLRYGKPVTPLEVALFEKLQEVNRRLTSWEELLDNEDRLCDGPESVESYLTHLEDNQRTEQDRDNEAFAEEITEAYHDATGCRTTVVNDQAAIDQIKKAIANEPLWQDFLSKIKTESDQIEKDLVA